MLLTLAMAAACLAQEVAVTPVPRLLPPVAAVGAIAGISAQPMALSPQLAAPAILMPQGLTALTPLALGHVEAARPIAATRAVLAETTARQAPAAAAHSRERGALGRVQEAAGELARPNAEPGRVLSELFDSPARPAKGEAVGTGAAEPIQPESAFGDKFRALYEPRGSIDLSKIDPDATPGAKSRKKAEKKLDEFTAELDTLQQRLYAGGKNSVLIVLQGMDTSGKDGTIRWVFGHVNPQGTEVHAFKKPTETEAAHHFLWRVRKVLPGLGKIGIFNRSQLADNGTLVLKFFLHIDKDEQKERLQARLDDPEKNWKFDPSDLEAREHWDEFQDVYGKILARTSTPWAPWYIIPANHKWYRNYAIGRIVAQAIRTLHPSPPPAKPGLDKVVIPD
ncbi:MAG: hypothetical protein NTX64_02775 [Elusimicrobia bacterium]|nr:hypothetical protein [Elusimicrobiota bacterium]